MIYIYPRGEKFSGQSSIGEYKNRTMIMPIYMAEKPIYRNLMELVVFYRNVFKERDNDFRLSLALGLSFLIRILPVVLLVRRRFEIEVHSGPGVVVGHISTFLLRIVAARSKKLLLLGELPRVEKIFKRSGVAIEYFSNVFIDPDYMSVSVNKNRKYKLGFLALNIESKGIGSFVELVEYCKFELKKDYIFVAGGPYHKSLGCSSNYTIDKFREYVLRLSNCGCEYVERVEKANKATFYSNIEYFVFLSEFKGEAQPMVLLEADYFGCNIIALNVGFVSRMKLRNARLFNDLEEIKTFFSKCES